MPDWTYVPLEPLVAAVLGRQRTRRVALALLALLIRHLGGRHWIPAVFGHPRPPAAWHQRLGASVPPQVARDAITVLPVQGASIVEVNPVQLGDVATVRAAATGRRCRVTVVADTIDTLNALRDYVDAATVGDAPNTVRLTDSRLGPALLALAEPSRTVLARTSVLTDSGPGWFNRVIEAAMPTCPHRQWLPVPAHPLRWPAWLWAAVVAAGLIVAGTGAAAITLGPVLLFYDRDFLGVDVADLHRINPHLVGFLQHDRITMASNMIGIGILYLGLAHAMREGHRWAQWTLRLSGVLVFGSYFYFLFTGGYVEPLHTVVVVVLVPMWVAAIRKGLGPPRWPPVVEGSERQRRRALWGQLVMIGVGAGLVVAGVVISAVGMTSVFVPTDLDFMATHAGRLHTADPRLLPFIAHDRAGFGGALVGAGLAVVLIAMWGWRRGSRWTWWSLALGCAIGTLPVLTVHAAIGYTHLEHLLPVYFLVGAAALSLALAYPYLTTGPAVASSASPAGQLK